MDILNLTPLEPVDPNLLKQFNNQLENKEISDCLKKNTTLDTVSSEIYMYPVSKVNPCSKISDSFLITNNSNEEPSQFCFGTKNSKSTAISSSSESEQNGYEASSQYVPSNTSISTSDSSGQWMVMFVECLNCSNPKSLIL